MTRESAQFMLEAGYLARALDHHLTPGRNDGFFATYGRKAFLLHPTKDETINGTTRTSFYLEVARLAIEKGVPQQVFDQLREEAALAARTTLETPGALEMLRAAQIASDRAADARRKARNN